MGITETEMNITINGLAFPTVHLNGTSKVELLEQLKNSYKAILTAEQILSKAAPHMRDYYILAHSEDQYELARSQHMERLKALVKIREQLEEVAAAIQLY